jgi:transcriptional regulator with XRE-family HTH domain
MTMRGKPGRPKRDKPRAKLRGSRVDPRVGREVRERLRQLLNAKDWTRQQLAEAAGVSPSAVTGWFNQPPTIPSGASLYKLADTARVCPRWLLLGERGLPRGDLLPDEPWQASLRACVRDKLLQQGFGALFLERFLPDAITLTEMTVSDWITRATPAEEAEGTKTRQMAVETAIRHRRSAEDILRVMQVDPGGE